jgi:hypothetical protein
MGGLLFLSPFTTIAEEHLYHYWWSLITTSTTNISISKMGINIFQCIISFELTNSTSFGGSRCFAGLCSEYAGNNTRWSICKNGQTWR